MEVDVRVNIKDAQKENTKIIEVEGILDSDTMPKADKTISDFIEKVDKKGLCLILDLNKLKYINSSAVIKLMGYFITMRNAKGSFKLVIPQGMVYDILDILGAKKVLEIYSTLEEALKDT